MKESSQIHPAAEIEFDALTYQKGPRWGDAIRTTIAICEIASPAEQLFLMWWWLILDGRPFLLPQKWIADYRGDFFVDGTSFVIKIDGRWHDESLAQVLYDRRRDRAILKAGYRIIRFTAQEVFADVTACIEEALAVIRVDALADV